jgi:uncharacterized protein YjbI with pentapeptide repeats
MPSPKGRRRQPAAEISLPELSPYGGAVLEAGGDHDAVDFSDGDFTGQDAADSRFLECRLDRCALDGVSLRRARFVDCLVSEVHGASVDLADSVWRDCHISGGRLGAIGLAGASWTGVRVRGSKLGFLDFAGAVLDDVVFEKCEIGAVDARSARMTGVSFVECVLDELNVAGATLSAVDLSGARLRSLVGVESLRGAIVSREQLTDLAPLLATQLGLEVRGA